MLNSLPSPSYPFLKHWNTCLKVQLFFILTFHRKRPSTAPPTKDIADEDTIDKNGITTVHIRNDFNTDFKALRGSSDIKSKVPKNAEATTVLVGAHSDLTSPVSAFVRLGMGCDLGNLAEVCIPVRFLFIILGPPDKKINYHEVGRAFATLMSERIFLEGAYRAKVSSNQLLLTLN